MLSHADLLKLKRWNTPTIYNGWEQITKHPRTTCFNLGEVRDFMPQMGPMVGYAVTLQFEPSKPEHAKNKDAWLEYRRYVASVPGPKILVLQDMDQPNVYGSFWGEVNANIHRALGCVGTITDGAIRDLDEMTNAGFKALAKCLCVGHAWSAPVRWGIDVEVFGCPIKPGQLIHADKHGFLAIPKEDEERLYEAALYMDGNECETIISAGRSANGLSNDEILENIARATERFAANAAAKFGAGKGEWQ
ncbi:MAG: RraA family protein [Defluviitaleaceae bacterium]|nr:RraA family protein [Defluviitaleaceae bacterium]